MKRDWDLIRKQLICIEEENDVLVDIPEEPKWTSQSEQDYVRELNEYRTFEARICGHLEMLIESGFIEGLIISRCLDGSFSYGAANPRLTMRGHDLLDTLRSESIWEKVKSTAKKKGIELSFDAVKALGAYALKQALE